MQTLVGFYGDALAAAAAGPLPSDFVTYRACRAYYEREAATQPSLMAVGSSECVGARWKHGPLTFEKYVGDAEPAHDPEGPFRFTVWQRCSRTDAVKGWHRGSPGLGFHMTGYSPVTAADGVGWSSHGRRHLSRWKKLLAGGQREVVSLSMNEYLAAYAKADQDRTMKAFFPRVLRDKALAHGERFQMLGSRRPGGPIDAGLAYLHIPEIRQSTHVSAFMAGAGKDDAASTGLVARWFQDCQRDAMTTLDFGFFWAPGDPKDWQGFSRFKAQFGVRLVPYPRALFRWFGRPFWRRAARRA